MKPTITEAEVLKALEDAAKQMRTDGDGFTLVELVESTGWGEIQARKRLKAAQKAGRLVVSRVLRENITGALQPVPAYRIAPEPKAKKRG